MARILIGMQQSSLFWNLLQALHQSRDVSGEHWEKRSCDITTTCLCFCLSVMTSVIFPTFEFNMS
jgi:hypothetical protein